MEYQCVNSRFLFFNGVKRYTIEFAYALSTWFVFANEERGGCLYSKKIEPKKSKSPNRDLAESVLSEYLEKAAITP